MGEANKSNKHKGPAPSPEDVTTSVGLERRFSSVTTHRVKRPLTFWPGAHKFVLPEWMRMVNAILGKLHSPCVLEQRSDPRRDMGTIEQMANLRLLVGEVLGHGVQGDFVELGCYTGSSAVVIGKTLQSWREKRRFHVYDRFDIDLDGDEGDVRATFSENMRRHGVPEPQVHQGDLFVTVPEELPARIAFAHIDCGMGGAPEQHALLLEHDLAALYPRLSPGAIVVLMDYHEEGVTWRGADVNPGVRMACDRFFADKPEWPVPLYGGVYSHGYFRKV